MLSHSVMSDSATPWTVALRAPLSAGILQARILEWAAMASSRGSPDPGMESGSPSLQVVSLLLKPPGKPKLFLGKHYQIYTYAKQHSSDCEA